MAASLRAAAQHACWASVVGGEPLSGRQLGEQFGRSVEWGRRVIADALVERARTMNGAAASPAQHQLDDEDDRRSVQAWPKWVAASATFVVAVAAATLSFADLGALGEVAGGKPHAVLWVISVNGMRQSRRQSSLSVGEPVNRAVRWHALPW